MAETMITISGDHDDDVPTRLGALGDTILFDVAIDSWLYHALNLSRFDTHATTEGFVPVPAAILWVALGRAIVAVDDAPASWYATDSAPSDTFFNQIAVNAHAKGFPPAATGGDQTEFPTAWHLRASLATFVTNNIDYSGEDNAFIVAGDEDRFDASCAEFASGHLELYNTLQLGSLIVDRHMDGWTLLLWLLGWSMEQPDESITQPFVVVARALEAAAKAASPHLAEASPADAVATFLRLGEQLPPDMLTDSFDVPARLRWIGAVRDYMKPDMRPAMLQGNFGVVLAKHDKVAKWTGTGGEAYIHFVALVGLLYPNAALITFDMVPRLGEALAGSYDAYWQEGGRGDNIQYLREMLGPRSGTSVTGVSAGTSGEPRAPHGRGAHIGAAQLTALLAEIETWRHGDEDGSEPHLYGLLDVIMQSGYTPAIKWLLGLAQPNLPSVFYDADVVSAPLEWENFFLDTVITGSDNKPDELLADLSIKAFSPTFVSNLKSGKISGSHIDWDKDFVCVILRELNDNNDAAAMTMQKVLCDSTRLAHHLGGQRVEQVAL